MVACWLDKKAHGHAYPVAVTWDISLCSAPPTGAFARRLNVASCLPRLASMLLCGILTASKLMSLILGKSLLGLVRIPMSQSQSQFALQVFGRRPGLTFCLTEMTFCRVPWESGLTSWCQRQQPQGPATAARPGDPPRNGHAV